MAALVGRDSEMARLRALLDDAAAGHAVTALVGGDAGVGKSRLVAEVMTAAGRNGFTVLCGQCAEIGDSVPYLPFADAFRTAPPGIAQAVKARPVLARLLPDGGEPAQGTDPSGMARQQMFGAVLGTLAELAAASPVLLVLEDLHWADATTRHLVTFLARMLRRERVAIIGTYRTDDINRRHPLGEVVTELGRLPSVALVELGPLPAAALAEHLSQLPNGPSRLSTALLGSLVERAEGNAYYAEELLAASSGSSGVLPSGLAALLLARVARVSTGAQQVLRAAAVAGRRADDQLVLAASGLDDAQYEEAVRELVAHQLLVPDGPDGYRFRHALLREAVYGDLLPGERTRLHGRFAALLATVLATTGFATTGFATTGPGAAAELAYHSLTSHDVPGALAASVRAGEEAERIGAPAEAHRHYDQALELWDRVADAEKLAGMSRGELGLESAFAAAASGDVPRAIQLLRHIRAGLGGDATAEFRARTGERLAYYLLQSDEPGWAADALRVIRETVEQAPAGPPSPARARAMATYALAWMTSGDSAAAEEWAQRARAEAAQSGADWVAADSLITLGMVSNREGNSDEAIRLFTAAHRQVADTSMFGVELRAAYHLTAERLARGDLAEAVAAAHAGVGRADAEGLGLAPYGLDVQHLHFQAHYAVGDWDHAEEVARDFPVWVTKVPEAVLSAMALFIDVARGNAVADERRTWLEPFWDDVFVAYIGRGLLAEQALWRGDTEAAIVEAEAALSVDAGWMRSPAAIRVAAVALSARADRASAARSAGITTAVAAEEAAGAVLLDLAREGARYPDRPKSVLGPEGRGWLARAEAEYQRLIGLNTPAGWEKTLAEFGPGYVYETARTQWRLAEALAVSGRAREAADVWRAAASTAAELRAEPLRAALDDLGRRMGLDGRGSRDAVKDGKSPLEALTPRESEVLRLMSRGLSNRQIGEELFISQKTASVHVSNILAKLGAATRTEAAAIARAEDT
ncbi:MAG TPA: AAA family ATPase [Trebonia sp.]|jgi:DNA-binding CsgD family transcriptional regulator|nr:AAA family ATPase [Trebonia sp.]